uniref:EamA domain-containing protein n=1 Tax=Helicotheca tamesis TaxID=374047 RepID=A0A7S2H8G2_9STRA
MTTRNKTHDANGGVVHDNNNPPALTTYNQCKATGDENVEGKMVTNNLNGQLSAETVENARSSSTNESPKLNPTDDKEPQKKRKVEVAPGKELMPKATEESGSGDSGDNASSKTTKKKKDMFSSKVLSSSSSSSSLQQSSSTYSENDNNGVKNNSSFKGRALLVFVSVLYATLTIALRALYNLPNPPSASALSASRGWIASFSFIPFLLSSSAKNKSNDSDKDKTTAAIETPPPKNVWITAFELALYNLGAQGLINIGLLKISSSARASFLTQTSVILTPLLSIFFGDVVKSTVWSGCIAALVGLLLLSSSGGGAAADVVASTSFGEGDIFVLSGALCWSIYLYRTSKVGSKYNEVQLQSIKTFLLAILYTIWFLFASFSGGSYINLWMGWKNITAWMILAYSAIGPGTIADIVQQQGQRFVSASEANVILSLEPVFTALLAMLMLGEFTSLRENVGGALIFLGALLASRD